MELSPTNEDSIQSIQTEKTNKIQSVIALIAASFDGTSLEEVEYFLQPSEPDHTSDAEMYNRGTELTARLYRLFL
ncbi:hypothetical protein LSM04_002403 [Trypanosoma melophagium]|uniref:uncharacterized protein n=1 Tax=Trypanosoma melophagium TaxID=715481 RepID=UPI00351A4F2D|nr:hypothetical protein LSM04_002403 [Trypanosoma melophagium]